ncbi:hypothetical protein [Tsukamurella pseudospumae]|uniref:Uncharacterized protein n=1 Tax=Tsukamurella pseudospumae TaxID=239498 RepID=A0A138A7N8_9ACTN|nr:hypothetical protein [Tsukamurella pseudospumae]KXP06489.1 hypothetical protein AXK60_10410 [Tsukamurella pseudospumae]
MDTSALRHAARDLAASLSEMTAGDLELPVAAGGDVGDLYLRILEGVAAPAPSRDRLAAAANDYGAGYERAYLRAVDAAIDALTGPDAVDAQLRETRCHTTDLDRALELG